MTKKNHSQQPQRPTCERAKLGHQKLEPRRLLNADFNFVGGDLDLFNFTNDNPGADEVTISESGGVYSFVLSDGLWSGDDSALDISGSGSNTLEVDVASLASLALRSTTGDQFDIDFGDFDFGGDVSITRDILDPATVEFGTVSHAGASSVLIDGTFTINAAATVDLQEAGNDFNDVNITLADDVSLTDVDDITLTTLEVSNDANIEAGGDVGLGTIDVTGDLNVATTSGDVTDSGTVTVGGMTQIDADDGSITLDQLNATGAIGLNASEDATIVNAIATDLKASVIGGDLDVTATTGDVTDSDVVAVTGTSQFTSTAGAITLDQLAATGSIGVNSLGNTTLVNATAIDFLTSNIGGNLSATALTGSITQSGAVTVGGTTNLVVAPGDIICMTDAANDFVGEVTGTGDTVEFVDANSLTAGLITAVDDIYLRAGATAAGGLTLNGDLVTSLPTGQVLLQADQGVTQDAGVITANDLLLGGDLPDEGTGSFELTALNQVNNLAADVVGEVYVMSALGLSVGSLAYVSACGTNEAISGASGTDKVRLDADGITLAAAVDSATVFLESTSGVTQTAAGVITSDNLMLAGDGDFLLATATNNTDNLAAALTAGSLAYADADDVNIAELVCDTTTITGVNVSADLSIDTSAGNGNITQSADAPVVVAGVTNLNAGLAAPIAGEICLTGGDGDADGLNDNDFVATVTALGSTVELVDRNSLTVGNITAFNDIFLRSGDGATGDLTLAGDLAVSNALGQVLLQSDSGVNQTGIITAAELLLGGDDADKGSGDFNLTQANVVGLLAADLQDALEMTNTTSLELADLTYISSCGTTEAICGLNIGGTLDLDIAGDLTQSAAVIVVGETNLTATGLICLTGGDCDADGLNDNDFGDTVSASGTTIEIVDRNDLIVGELNAVDDIFLRAGFGTVADTGQLSLNGDLTTTAAAGQILLQADLGAEQAATSVITTSQLIVGGDDVDEGAGTFNLTGANVVGQLAAEVVDATGETGEVYLISTLPLVVGNLNYSSACGTTEAILGVSADTKVRLDAASITLNFAIDSETVFLESAGGVTQAPLGIITATNLMLSGNGLFDLSTANNDTDNLAADINGTLNYFDIDDVTIAELDCDAVTICGLDITGDLNLVTNNGDVFQADDPTLPAINSAAVIVGGNVTIDTGTGNICLTGGDCDGDGLNDNLFGGTLTIVSTGDVVIAEDDDLSIDSLIGGGSYRFIANNIQINTAITANQLLLEASAGVDYNGNLIDVTDLLLRGTGAFDFGATGDTVNSIDNLAADIDGSLSLINGNSLNIGDLTFLSGCGDVNICGVNIDIGGGELGSLELRLVDADLSQSAAITVEGNTTLATGLGDICLTGGDCDADGLNDNDFNTITIESADDAEIVDRNSFTVNSATVNSQLRLYAGDVDPGQLELAGNITAAEQVLLQASNGVVQTAGVINTTDLLLGSDVDPNAGIGDFVLDAANVFGNLAGNVTGEIFVNNISSTVVAALSYVSDCGTVEDFAGLAGTDKVRIDAPAITLNAEVTSSFVFLNSASTITQNVAGVIDATNLMISAGGNVDLDNANNDVQNLAGVITGQFDFLNQGDLLITELDCDSITICGLDVTGDWSLRLGGTLEQDAAVIIGGTTTIVAGGDVCLTGGDCDGDGLNDNDFVGEVTATAETIEIVDRNSLTTGVITAVNDVFLRSGDNGAGALTLNGNVTTSAATGQVLLQSDSGVTQAVGTAITTNELLLGGDLIDEGSGIFDLSNNNAVNFLASNLMGSLQFVNTLPVIVANLTYTSDCGTSETIVGANATDKVRIDADGIQVNSLVTSDFVYLNSTADVTQTATGQILADNLMVVAGGLVDLLAGANDVNNLAIQAPGNVRFNDIGSFLITTLDCDGDTVCGISTDGNLELVAGDSITQDAAVIVLGTTDIVAGGLVCLTGGDCDLDGLNDNDFVGVVNASGSTVEIVDRNALIAGNISAADDVFLRSGDNGVGTLTIIGDIATSAAAGQVLLQSDSGVSQVATSTITTSELLLGGDGIDERSGNFNLIGTNAVGALAANVETELRFNNTIALAVADLNYTSACGTAEAISGINAATKVRLEADGIAVNESIVSATVYLESTNGTSQAADAPILTTNLLLTGSGVFNLTSPLNNTANLAADIDGTLNYADLDDVFITRLLCDGDAVDGVQLTGDLVLNVGGSITQDSAVIVGGTTDLTAGGLICLTGGDLFLDADALNDNDFVGEVTATGSTVEIVDRNALIVGEINAVDDIFLRSGDNGSGLLTLNGNLTTAAATGQVLLQSDSGVTQAVTSVITTSELLLGGDAPDEGTGSFDLVGTNAVATFAADIDGELHLINGLPLTVGSLSYVSACGTSEAIIGADVTDKVRLDADGITINNVITSTTVFLESSDGVTQAATGQITATNLMLAGTGLFDLTNPLNNTDNLAADIDGSLDYTDVDDVFITRLLCDGDAVDGVQLTGDLVLNVGGSITQDSAVIVGGTTDLTAGGLICLTGGDLFLDADALNDNDFVGEVTATGSTVEIVDRNALVVGEINAVDDIFLRSGDNGSGALTLNGNLTTTAPAGQVLLQSDSGVTQAITSVITTSELLLGGDDPDEGSGSFDLVGTNAVATFAADIDGELHLINGLPLTVGSLNYVSVCGTNEAIAGAEVTDKVRLDAAGITINNAITSTTVFLESSAGVTQAATGQITATNLMLAGTGLFDLTNPLNNTDNLAAQIDGTLNYTDVDDVFITRLLCDGDAVDGVQLTGDLVLNVGGSITQDSAVIVGGTTSLTAVDEICLTGGDLFIDPDTLNDNDFVGEVTASGSTVEIVDRNALVVGNINAADNIFLRSGDNGTGALTLNGNLTTTAPAGQVLLQSDSGVTQAAASVITTSELLLGGDDPDEGGGLFNLIGPNVVQTLAADVDGLGIVNTLELTIGDLTYASICGTTEAITGVDAPDKIRIIADGIVVTEELNAITVFLESTDGVTQDPAGQIIATNLMLSGTGLFDVTNAGNNVDNLAAVIDGSLNYVDVDDIFITTLDCAPITICGVSVTGDLNLNVGGSISQDAAVVVSGETTLTAVDEICLTGGTCDPGGLTDDNNENDFTGIVRASGSTVEIVDRNALIVGNIDAIDDIFLRSGDNGSGLLTLNGNLTTTAATGQVLLQSDSGVTQIVTSVITTNELLLGGDDVDEGSGNFNLVGSNAVDALAANIDGELRLINSLPLVVDALTYSSVCGTSEAIVGVDATNKVRLEADGITINELVTSNTVYLQSSNGVSQAGDGQVLATDLMLVGTGLFDLSNPLNNTANLAAEIDGSLVYFDADDVLITLLTCDGDTVDGVQLTGNFELNVGGSITQDSAVIVGGTTSLTAVDEICLTGGDLATDADVLNDNDFVGEVTASGATVEIVDSNALIAGEINATDDIFLRSGDNGIGALTLNGNLTTSAAAGQVLLQSDSGVTQVPTSVITTSELLLGGNDLDEGTGIFDLVGTNAVNSIAATIDGELHFINGLPLIVDALTYSSVCGTNEAIDGINVTDKVRLDADGITLNAATTSTTVYLESTDGVLQNPSGTITATNLMLAGEGFFALNQPTNDTDNLAALIDGSLNYTDANDVLITELACDLDVICGVELTSNLSLVVGGSIRQDAAVIVGGSTVLTAGDEICLTGGDCDADGLNDNNFVGIVTASGSTVEIVDRNALTVGSITAANDIFLRAGDNGFGTLTINGNLGAGLGLPTGQVLLQADSGVNQIGGIIVADQLILGSEANPDARGGNFVLNNNNRVAQIAAQVDGDLTFRNLGDVVDAGDLQVADLTYSSICLTVENVTGVNVGGNLAVTVDGLDAATDGFDLTQTIGAPVIVAGTTTLDATGNIVLLGGTDDPLDAVNPTANDFVGVVDVNQTLVGEFVEIADVNAMTVNDVNATSGIHLLASGLTLTGDIIAAPVVVGTPTTVVLQSAAGVSQATTASVQATNLIVGGDDAPESTGHFNLVGNNQVTNLAGGISGGSLNLTNTGNLTVVSSLVFTGSAPTNIESSSGLFVGVDNPALLDGVFGDPNNDLANTIQGGNVNTPAGTSASPRYNPKFGQFLDVADTGIAIQNTGSLTVETAATMRAALSDIYLTTTAAGNAINVDGLVEVSDNTNRILAVAGGDLNIAAGGELRRGTEGSVTAELNQLLLLNPGIASSTFAQVDLTTFTQSLQFVYGELGELGELKFDSTIFWGIEGREDDTFQFGSLNAAQISALQALLFDSGNAQFESRSLYEPLPGFVGGVSTFDGVADGNPDTVRSQELGSINDIAGRANDTSFATASFRQAFLQVNSEFRNVQFLFNDAQINIFSNAATDLTDLNVAVDDFEGRARVGESPTVEVTRTEFTIPQRVEIAEAPGVEFFESIVVNDEPLFVQTVQEKFFVVIYFDSQFEADQFEAEFENLGRDDTGEKDFENVKKKILEAMGLNSLEWDASEEGATVDANQIREVLERAKLDLDGGQEDWLKRFEAWLKRQSDDGDTPAVPRGVFKILEIENGKATIQGDDVDRRFVPEPDNEDGFEEYPFEMDQLNAPAGGEASDPQTDQSQLLPADTKANSLSPRLARWAALGADLTPADSDDMATVDVLDSGAFASPSLESGSAFAAGGLGLLAAVCGKRAGAGSVAQELQAFAELKSENPDKNVFSRAARFRRRNEPNLRDLE